MAAGLRNEIDHGPREKTGQDGGGSTRALTQGYGPKENASYTFNYNWQGETNGIYGCRNRQ